jgi:signal transduction histidine kinase
MSKVFHVDAKPFDRLKLSLFEKVILANSMILIFVALVGLWITSHNLEAHHYLIDTSFIVLATLLGLLVNVALIRASFRPLFGLMQTIRKVSAGDTHIRAQVISTDSEIGELAQAFNNMLDRIEQARRDQAMLILQAQEEERRRLALELHSALRWLAEDSRERLQMPVEVHLEHAEDIIRTQKQGALYETTLFRIAQESLTNAARYAHPQCVWLSLTQSQQAICLQVRDDGIGFDPSQKFAGLGIAGMRERASLLEGSLTIVSRPGHGTTVEVFLPLSTSSIKDSEHA